MISSFYLLKILRIKTVNEFLRVFSSYFQRYVNLMLQYYPVIGLIMFSLQTRNLSHYITFLIFCVIAFVISAQTVEIEEDLGTIIASNVIFRHGHRTIIEPYPSDPYSNATYWPEGFGQLTNIGKEQEFELGQWLRKRYSTLLIDTYSKEDVHVISTDVDRTLMSAESALAGLYPPTDSQRWNKDIAWQPIPVHTAPEHLDSVLAMKAPCPRFDEEYKKTMASKPILDVLEVNKEFFDYLSQYAGEKVDTFYQIQNLYSTLYIETLHNYSLPEWTRKVYPEPLANLSGFAFGLLTFTDELRRLKTGPLVKEMLQHFKAKVSKIETSMSEELTKDKNKKLWLYSAHDETVASVLNHLKVFDWENPPFSACVLIELRKRGNDHFVTVHYRNSTDDAHLLTLPHCTAMCPYHEFVKILEPLIPVNWQDECQPSRIFNLTDDLPYNSLAVFVIVASTVLVFLLLASMSIFWQKQRPSRFYRKLKTDTI